MHGEYDHDKCLFSSYHDDKTVNSPAVEHMLFTIIPMHLSVSGRLESVCDGFHSPPLTSSLGSCFTAGSELLLLLLADLKPVPSVSLMSLSREESGVRALDRTS